MLLNRRKTGACAAGFDELAEQGGIAYSFEDVEAVSERSCASQSSIRLPILHRGASSSTDHDVRPRSKGPPIHLDGAIGMLGKRVERRARVDYTHTPDWEYWDLNKKGLLTGVYNSSFTLSILTKPERNEKDKPERVQMSDIIQNGVLCNEVRDAIDDKLDERCRMDDAEPH